MIPPKAPKVCERCGVTYIPTSKRQKYCKECRKVLEGEAGTAACLDACAGGERGKGERHDLWAVHFMEVLLTDREKGGRRKLAASFSQERTRDSLLSLGEKHQIR